MIFCLLLCLFTPLALLAVSEEPHHTTAYIANPGQVDNLLTFSTYFTDSFWNRHGKKQPTYNRFRRKSYLLYSEYAINNCNSIFFNGGFSQVHESLNGNSRCFEDTEVGWKHLFHKTRESALTLQLIGIIPMGKKKSSIRYGKAGIEADFLYSYRFCLKQRFGWCDFALGYRHYQGFPSDQIRFNAALGCFVNRRAYLIAEGKFDYGLFNGRSSHNLNNVIFHPNYRLLKVHVECVVRLFTQFFVSIGGYKHIWGRNSGVGGGYFCGAWINF
jgi:hypothetical protein